MPIGAVTDGLPRSRVALRVSFFGSEGWPLLAPWRGRAPIGWLGFRWTARAPPTRSARGGVDLPVPGTRGGRGDPYGRFG